MTNMTQSWKHSAPWSVTWYITKRCNLLCKHCFVYEEGEIPKRSEHELSFEDACKVVDQLAEAGVFSIAFGGGEVFTLSWFCKLVEHCSTRGVEVFLSTNGALLTDEKAARLRKAGVQVVQLSLDGATAQTHDAIRGKGNFAKVLQAAERLHRHGIIPQFAFTLMRQNQGEVHRLLELCLEKKIPLFKLQLFIPSGRADEEAEFALEPEKFQALVEDIRAFEEAQEGRFRVDYPCFMGHIGDKATLNWQPKNPATQLSCGAGTTRAVIFENGGLGNCEFMRSDQIGDLRNDSFMQLWNSDAPAMERWRRLDLVGGKCGSCGYQAECGMGCRANAYFAGGDFFGDDPACIAEAPKGVTHPHLISPKAAPRNHRLAPPSRNSELVQIGVPR
ncbi:MAG: radical SAM protein [Myxococcota bacterium]|nr:radical SAM protein [Myxococcota bacterium]